MTAKQVEDLLQRGSRLACSESFSEDDPQYQLVADCIAFSADIDNEIVALHNLNREIYGFKFPELDSLVHHPIDYARVIKRIGNEMDLTLVDLKGLFGSAMAMVLSLTASTTSGKPLSDQNLQRTIDACDRALALDSDKKKVLHLVESRMGRIAPNVSSIVGAQVAAKLILTAGGLSALANTPSCNFHILGSKKETLAAAVTSQFRAGYLEQAEIFQTTPPALRKRVCELLASKSALAARVDSTRGDPTGNIGRSLLQGIRKEIEKLQAQPPAQKPKPIPLPVLKPKKKKRCGRQQRKMKEKRAVTDMGKLLNRAKFGVPEKSSLGDGIGEGYGMLGQAGCGKLRASFTQNKLRLGIKAAKKFKKGHHGSTGPTSGLTSSLALAPVLGMTNPQVHGTTNAHSTYFSGTFSEIKRTLSALPSS